VSDGIRSVTLLASQWQESRQCGMLSTLPNPLSRPKLASRMRARKIECKRIEYALGKVDNYLGSHKRKGLYNHLCSELHR
jgi:hypothetical protein